MTHSGGSLACEPVISVGQGELIGRPIPEEILDRLIETRF